MEQKIKLLNQENNQIMVSIYLIIKYKRKNWKISINQIQRICKNILIISYKIILNKLKMM